MSVHAPLLETIEPDEPTAIESTTSATKPVVTTPTSRVDHVASHNDLESGPSNA
jgi:hypothetical protein